MPILPPEPDIFPDSLLADDSELEQPPQWWVYYTLPRREKELMRRLRRMEIAFCCPLVKHRNRSPSGRVRVSSIPLFPGYVFMAGTEEQRYGAMTTQCISRCIEVPDPSQLVRDLRQIYRLIHCDAPLTPESRIEPGMRVRVRSGSLMGLEGTVLKRRSGMRLLVAVQFLQQGVSVQVADYEVETV